MRSVIVVSDPRDPTRHRTDGERCDVADRLLRGDDRVVEDVPVSELRRSEPCPSCWPYVGDA